MAEWSNEGVVISAYEREAATANVKAMLFVMAKPNKENAVGFDEDRVVGLYELWLIVGSWMRTPDYWRIYGIPLAFNRAPGAISGNLKYSELLQVALKNLAAVNEKDNDAKNRRAAFDRAQERMFDFMYAFHTGLTKQSKARAEAFRPKLQSVQQYVRKNYERHWK